MEHWRQERAAHGAGPGHRPGPGPEHRRPGLPRARGARRAVHRGEVGDLRRRRHRRPRRRARRPRSTPSASGRSASARPTRSCWWSGRSVRTGRRRTSRCAATSRRRPTARVVVSRPSRETPGAAHGPAPEDVLAAADEGAVAGVAPRRRAGAGPGPAVRGEDVAADARSARERRRGCRARGRRRWPARCGSPAASAVVRSERWSRPTRWRLLSRRRAGDADPVPVRSVRHQEIPPFALEQERLVDDAAGARADPDEAPARPAEHPAAGDGRTGPAAERRAGGGREPGALDRAGRGVRPGRAVVAPAAGAGVEGRAGQAGVLRVGGDRPAERHPVTGRHERAAGRDAPAGRAVDHRPAPARRGEHAAADPLPWPPAGEAAQGGTLGGRRARCGRRPAEAAGRIGCPGPTSARRRPGWCRWPPDDARDRPCGSRRCRRRGRDEVPAGGIAPVGRPVQGDALPAVVGEDACRSGAAVAVSPSDRTGRDRAAVDTQAPVGGLGAGHQAGPDRRRGVAGRVHRDHGVGVGLPGRDLAVPVRRPGRGADLDAVAEHPVGHHARRVGESAATTVRPDPGGRRRAAGRERSVRWRRTAPRRAGAGTCRATPPRTGRGSRSGTRWRRRCSSPRA